MTNTEKILVTGGAGFIGTNFIHYLLEKRQEIEVFNIDAITYAGNPGNFDALPDNQKKRYHFIHGDIQDKSLLQNVFQQHSFNYLVHFAAESHVDRSIVNPAAFIETNILGTFQLLEASLNNWREDGTPDSFRFLHVSTDEVYGSLGAEGYFTEETSYDPSSPYSASKASSDHFVKAYFRTYGLPAMISNCSNNYGPFQFPEKLIPLMILNIIEEKPLPVYGDGKNVRDWLYVIDHCDALIKILENGIPGETYNIGGGAEYQNIEIVHLLCDILDRKLNKTGNKSSKRLIDFVTDRPGHDKRYAIDASKINKELSWAPRFKFVDAIEETVEWYLKNTKWIESVKSGEYRKWINKNYGKRDLGKP